MNSREAFHSKVLFIIPARGGSKGIPGKNLKRIAGKTLIEHAYDCAKAATHPLTTVLSSDDARILEHGETLGMELVVRPEHLASDRAKVTDAILHCLYEMENRKKCRYEIVILLQATSPIRSGKDLDTVIGLFEDDAVENVISVVCSNEMHPARMYRLEEEKLVPLEAKYESANRQEINPVYYRNGCFYAVRRKVLVEQKTLMSKNKTPYIMPWSQLCNIDEPVDLIVAEALMKAWKEGKI